ncbi:methyltransferase family protein [Bacillus oleivorans]|uniref:Methyltransferase family protein n=1 Tax=Bacillus oleivorans TaxID=1448271 RepID=A0A285D501_9BACI|nr:class I SAM-dependent methyltransferase [Bacillus oleivorans]SNX74877.1 methyltransferase family protein [Bacillus oleivorans]
MDIKNHYKDLILTESQIINNQHRDAVGGLWEEIGKLQFEFLVKNGLKPEHSLLDVGCGALRGGIHFINYLYTKNYYGIDINPFLMDAGIKELEKASLLEKKPYLLVNGDFQFDLFNQKFDFALAQSLFTHLPLNHIHRCLINISKVLKEGGKFYATFFETENKFALDGIIQSNEIVTYLDSDPYHYHFSVFTYLIEGLPLTVQYIGDWKHPRNQKMVCFSK